MLVITLRSVAIQTPSSPLTLPIPDVDVNEQQSSETTGENVAEVSRFVTDKTGQLKTTKSAKPDSLPIEPQQLIWIIEYKNIRSKRIRQKLLYMQH